MRRLLIYLATWALFALFFASQTVVYGAFAGRPINFRMALTYPVTDALIWAALAPGVLWLARRWPLEPGRLARGLALHLAVAPLMALIASALAMGVFTLVGATANAEMRGMRLYWGLAIGKLHNNILVYAAIVGVRHLVDYHRRYRDRELRASQLEARLAEAQLEGLRAQLHPHFLFNTLHAISALMHRDVEAADRMLTRLSDLLRLMMETGGAQEVPLRQELDFLQGYLEIQQARLGQRLRVALAIEPTTLDALVPHLLLQPLVENAIRHGIAPRAEGGTLEVRAWRDGERLHLTVRDDGPGLPSQLRPAGVGLTNTRARLAQLYAGSHTFEVANDPRGGVCVAFSARFREAGAALAGRSAAGPGASA
jgi:two-component system LytT family sensor kinase